MVDDRDPLEVIAQTPARIRELLRGRSREELTRRPADDEWSAAEMLGHLFGVEIATGFRRRMVLTAERPSYPGYDEKAWGALPEPPVEHLWPALKGFRAYDLWLLRSPPRSAWDRAGLHSEVGPETLEAMILAYAGHDLGHLNQLERALTRIGA